MNTTVNIEVRSLIASDVWQGPDVEQAISIAERMKAFCNPVRLRILKILGGIQECVISVTRLIEMVGIDQSCVNRHVRALASYGFLRLIEEKGRPGRTHYYIVEREAIRAVLRDLLSYAGIASIA